MESTEFEKRVIVTQPCVGVCAMQVCAEKDVTDEELLAVANRENPAGTEHGWTTVIRAGRSGPVPCEKRPRSRWHFMLEC